MRVSADRVIEDLYSLALSLRIDEDAASFDRQASRYMSPELVRLFRKSLDEFISREEQYTRIRRFVLNRLATVEVTS